MNNRNDKYVKLSLDYKFSFIIVMFVFFLSMTSCEYSELIEQKKNRTVFTDFEFENKPNKLNYDIVGTNTEVILRGEITTDKSHSGVQSLLITGNNKFTLTTKVANNSDINYIKVSVWRYDKSGNSVLVVQGNKESGYYTPESKPIEKTEDGWEKIEIRAFPPRSVDEISIYVWSNKADTVYLDDYQIEYLEHQEFPKYKDEEKLLLYFSDNKISELNNKIEEAFSIGVHINDGEWTKGIMSDEIDVMPIKARLKGDWLDHLEGKKYSLRIKMRDDYVFKRMKVFSIQHPKVRDYLAEFVSHKLFSQEDVLTTRYGFIPVYKNTESTGIYAWEEHFAKQLIEYNLRREGPILKFDEDPFWRMNQYNQVNEKWLNWPYFEGCRILAFGMNKTLRNPVLKKQFSIGQSLMYQYKSLNAPIEEVFDVDALAKYWALIDILNARHGLAWHNHRFYYNPVICKLEPVSFDNFTDINEDDKDPIMSPNLLQNFDSAYAEHLLSISLFKSEELVASYIDYVEKYSEKSFLDQFFNNNSEEFIHYEELLQREFTEYKYHKDHIYKNAEIIRSKLPLLKEKMEAGYIGKEYNFRIVEKPRDTTYFVDAIPEYINAYYSSKNEDISTLRLENYTSFDIVPVGIANDDGRLIYLFEDEFLINQYLSGLNDTTFDIPTIKDATQFVYNVKNRSDILYSELSLWEKKTGYSPYQKIKKEFNLVSSGLFKRSNDTLYVSGNHEVTEKILVPKEYIVVFKADTKIDFIDSSCFISHAPVIFNGEKDKPVIISSSDSTANGFTVLQAESKSYLKHVKFVDMNTLDYEGWTLTGAVNFYESDVNIDHCIFESNHCEDALNIIRSNFKVSAADFINIFSDAFDSDFSTGILEDSYFEFVGNDAIDFSTSQIHIEDCVMNHIADKGISGGEGSTLWVSNTSIVNCNIGAASKDLSEVELLDVSIDSCNYALVALIKKPEYGAATIKTKNLKISNCEINHLIEDQSILFLNGRKIEGNEKNVARLFY